jgi:hypothetical protein
MRNVGVLCVAAGLLTAGLLAGQEIEVLRIDLPDHPTAVLKPYSSFDYTFLSESSGIVRSRRDPDLFWTHNDSGDFARIFPVDREGAVVGSHIRIKGASNKDWEDIATDDQGRLLIADLGNNLNTRTDLAIYIVAEPEPGEERAIEGARRIPVHYPEQDSFPPTSKNFDAEALFWARGSIYVLTKHRSDTATTLYRLDSMDEEHSNPLTRLSSFDIGGQVTGADASPDGSRVVVLTYGGLWVFEAETDDYFRGAIRWLPITARQCEGVCFDGPDIVITNEQRQIFRVPMDRLLLLRE